MSGDRRQIRAGDVVKLNGGDWSMVVLELEGEGACCGWLVDSKPQTAWVAFPCLVKVADRQERPQVESVKVAARLH